ncbi:MAG: hypothetical protein ACREER_09530 [Alphaproteobacteria bacterium]
MTDRSLTAAVTTETTAAAAKAALFARFNFDSGTTYLWSGIGEITTAALGSLPAATWTGAGTLGAVSAIEEASELRAVGLTFTLSGVPSSLLSIALGEHYQGRAATVWLAFFDAAWVMVADPVQVFAGRMDVMEIAEGGATATIRVSAENRLIDLERNDRVRHYTPDDQKADFPGDLGLDYVPKMIEKVIYWGRVAFKPKKPGSSGGSDPGTGGGHGRGGGGGAGGSEGAVIGDFVDPGIAGPSGHRDDHPTGTR